MPIDCMTPYNVLKIEMNVSTFDLISTGGASAGTTGPNGLSLAIQILFNFQGSMGDLF